MAGDWIKMRTDLPHNPKFLAVANSLSLTDDELLSALYRLASWFSRHSQYGQMSEQDALVIDHHIGCSGLCEHLIRCGWIRADGGRVWLSGFAQPFAARKVLGTNLRAEILAIGMCAACGSTNDLEIDHVVPIVRGGTGDRSNLQALCVPCNRAKGRMTMTEFMAERRAI